MSNSDNFFSLVSEFQNNIDLLNKVLSGSDKESIYIDGITKPTISKAIADNFSKLQTMVSGRIAFRTKADIDGNTSFPNNTLAEVWGDSVLDNNGLYGMLSGTWIKSTYDVISALNENKILINNIKYSTENQYQSSVKTSVGIGVENLINPLAIKQGHIPTTDGYVANASYDSSDFIAVNPNQPYWVRSYIGSVEVDNFAGRNIYWYNSERVYISGIENIDLLNGPHESPIDTAFVKVSWKNSNSDNHLIYFGAQENPKNPEWKGVLETGSGADIMVSNLYSATIKQEGFEDNSVPSKRSVQQLLEGIKSSAIEEGEIESDIKKNIFDPDAVVAGRFMNPTGAIVENSGYSTSGYIPIDGGSLYTGNILGSVAEVFRKSCFFNKDLNVIAGGVDAWFFQFTSPELAAFVVVSVISKQIPDSFCLQKGDSQDYYEYNPYIGLNNILDPNDSDVLIGSYINPNGSIAEGAAYTATGYIGIEPGETYTASQKGDLNQHKIYRKSCFYDEFKRVVAGGFDNSSMSDVFTAPFNGKYIRLSVVNTQYDLQDYCLLKGTEKQYVPFSAMTFVRLRKGYGEQFDNPQDLVTRQRMVEYLSEENDRTITLFNSDKILFTGCSYDEGGYSIKGKNWIDRLSERHDYICGNYGTGGYYILAIADRLTKDEPKYGISPSKFNPTYITIANTGNESLPTAGYTLDLYKEQILLAKNAIESLGSKLILGTNHKVNGNQLLEASLKSMASDCGIDYMGVGSLGEKVMSKAYGDFWTGGHPNVRGMSFSSGEWQYFLEQMPRPGKSIKVFRPRTGVDIDAKSLTYDTNDQRMGKFKEILIGGRSMNEEDGSSDQYDRMTMPFTMQTNDSEYAALMEGSEVRFNDAVLIEFIGDHIGIEEFTATVNGSPDIEWYVMQNRGTGFIPPLTLNKAIVFQVSEIDYLYFTDPVGEKFTSTLIDNGGSAFSFDGKLKSFSMGRGYFLCFTSDVKTPKKTPGPGTIDRVSGGSVSIVNHLIQYTYHYSFWAGLHKPSGLWSPITSTYDNGEYTIGKTQNTRAFQLYDKVKLLGIKTGEFTVSGMSLTFTGGKKKPQTIKEITQKPTGVELFQDRGFDSSATGWLLNGNIIEQMPEQVRSYPDSRFFGENEHHVTLTKDDTGFGNALARTIDFPGKQTDFRGFRRFVVRVIVRVFPKIFNPAIAPDRYHANTPQITPDSCDYGMLLLKMGDGSGADYIQKRVIDIGWQEIVFETTLPPFMDQVELALLRDVDQFDIDNEIQVFDVSCQLV